MREYNRHVDGLNVRVLEEGEGPPVLLLHGGTIGFSADMWSGAIEALAKRGFRALAYDQPSYGHSDDPNDFSLAYRQAFITKFLDAEGIAKATLIGHSQAGGLVVGAALDHADRTSHVVVLGTGSLLPPLAGGQAAREIVPPTEPQSIEDTRALLKANLFHHELITVERLVDYHRLCIGRHFTNARKRALAGSSATRTGVPLWQRLGEVSVPLMLMYGREDRGAAEKRIPLARERAPNGIFHLLQDCHHIIQWDRADAFIASTADFLRNSKVLRKSKPTSS